MTAEHLAEQRGQSLVEFALILPLFILLLTGLLDGGRAIYAYNTIANAARSAARVAIVDQDPATVVDTALARAVGLGLNPADVTFTPCSVEPCTVSVRIVYDFDPVTPFMNDLLNPMLSSTAQMTLEVVNP